MSKPNIRKITVDPTKCNADSRRPSVFERLGTKPAANITGQNTTEYCRNWAQNGNCSYGKTCKYANTHILISPSKRVKKDNATAPTTATVPIDDPFKRLTLKIVKKTSHSPDLNLEEWNQTDLEYEDEKVLERRRQLLQRELELQMKKDKEVHGKDKAKHKKKAMTSSSSSRSSSTSSSSSSSSSDDSSSSSTSDSRKKVKKVKSKRHHSASSDYDESKERKKKLKLKRLGTKSDKLLSKKKRKLDVPNKKEIITKTSKKITAISTRKHSTTTRAKSPVASSSHTSSSKAKERIRSDSPKTKIREAEKDKHYKKVRENDEVSTKDAVKTKTTDKAKEVEKSKTRPAEDRSKADDRSKPRTKEKERRSRTPPLDRAKHQHSKEPAALKSRRSRTPEKPPRSKRDPTPPRHPDKSSTSRSREVEKKDRDPYKPERSKDRDDSRKTDQPKPRPSSSQDENHRKNTGRDFDDKSYVGDRSRQRSKERRDKEPNVRDDRSHSRLARDQREKEREEVQERCRERQRERDRDKDTVKMREREIPPLMATTAVNPMDKTPRYGRDKERFKDGALEKSNLRDRRSDRERERSEKPLERERGSQRFDARYDRSVDKEITAHKEVERERPERFPRERSLDRMVDKNIPPPRDHIMERETMYDRDRHRRFNPRFDRGHPPEHERKEPPHVPAKMDRLPDRRDAPRRSIEMDRNFDRSYARLPPEHWEDHEEQQHIDYREHHPLEDDRRKPIETRRYNSPFDERRGRDDRPPPRYGIQADRPFDEPHHPVYGGDKMRPGVNRDESSNDNWEMHHDMEHGSRDRNYPNSDWEEREWRARHPMWDRESLPRSDAHEEEWGPRYDSPMPDWKLNEGRKWENQPPPMRGPYRNERIKELDMSEPHNKRRPYNTPELRDECSTHGSKQGSLHGSMKEEPINKKLMELAEGRPRRSREKSADSFPKRMLPREKSEVKEPPLLIESKRPCLDESLQTLHTESDLSDISDDPDDILNMEEEDIEPKKTQSPKKGSEIIERESQPSQIHEPSVPSPKDAVEEAIFTKEKESSEPMEFRNMEEDNMETMDFEEISDGELEEDIKTSGKGLGDALGVDWESLVKESQPRRLITSTQDTAQSRWQCKAIFQRIGISVSCAGPELVESLTKKYKNEGSKKLLLNDIALLHTALVRQSLTCDTAHASLVNDDLLYRNYDEEDDEDDEEILKPCTSLYEEAKMLLQQAA